MNKKQLVDLLNSFSDDEAVMVVIPADSMPNQLDGKSEYSWAICDVVKHDCGVIAVVSC